MGNEEVAGTSSRRLTSTLIAELSQSSTSPHTISCSSGSETQLLQFQVAGTCIKYFKKLLDQSHFYYTERPREPVNVTVSMHPDQSLRIPYSLTVQWAAPANSDKFDLEHYTIQALSSEVDKRYELNVTGSELEYPFGLIMSTSESFPQYKLSNLTVSAVSRCSLQGSEASADFPILKNVNPDDNVNANTVLYNLQFMTTLYSNGNILHAHTYIV